MYFKKRNQKHKSNTKKGFTLVEVLVGLACSVIVIATITGSLVFVNKINTQLIETSSTLYKVKELKHYILNNFKEGDDCIKNDNKDIVYITKDENKDDINKIIYSNITSITNVEILTCDDKYTNDVIIKNEEGNETTTTYYTYTTCTISYNQNGDKEYKFIVMKNPQEDKYIKKDTTK